MRDPVVLDRGGYQPGLDGIRGVAILLVLGQHAPTRPYIDGFVGVTVFFCLSGYLITGLLLRELHGGGIDLRAFYRRRAARLCPALFTVVGVTAAVMFVQRHHLSSGLLHRDHIGAGQIAAGATAALTYTTSLFDWAGHPFATYDWFNYTWSLSVEEQFYLLWPFLLLWGYRRGPRTFAAVTASLVGATLALDLYLGLTRSVRFDAREYFGSDTNALPILTGALLAIVVANGWLTRTLRIVGLTALPAVALLPVLAHSNDPNHPSLVIAEGTGLTLLTLVGVVTRPRGVVGTVLASPPMRWLGQWSYSIYLWNVLARIAVLSRTSAGPVALGHTHGGDALYVAMLVVLAEASYRLVERPLRARWGRRPGASPGVATPAVQSA